MFRIGLVILTALFLCSKSFAYEVAALRSETAEELLLFFEKEELVIATKRPTAVRKAPAIATVITAKEIRNMGARNLMDVIKMVPGFGLSITEFGATMFEVRGIRTQTSEKILIMIDGHSINKSFTGSGMYGLAQDMPVENIRQIEVIRGPGSALYGANAFVAVINVITRDPEEIDGVEVKGGYGSFDTRKANVTAGKSLENGLDLSGSLDLFTTDGEHIMIQSDALTGTPFTTAPGDAFTAIEKTDMFVKASYKDFTFRGHYIKRENSGLYIGLAYALTDESINPIEYYWSELSYHPVINSRLSSEFKLYFDHYAQTSSIELEPEGFAGSFPNGMIGMPWLKDRTIGGELQLNYEIAENNHLTVGMMYEKMKQYDVHQYANFDPTLFPPVPIDLGPVQEVANWNRDARRNIRAVYIQDEWDIKDNLNLTAGIRHDHYSDVGSTTNPRVGLVWGFMENANLKLLYGQAFRAPNFVELYNQNNPVNAGNSELDPEKIRTYEAGIGWRVAESFSIDLTYFKSRIDDIIVWDTSTTPALHVNGDNADIDGIELMLTGQYTTDNYWKLSYTYQDPKDPDTDKRLPYVPLNRAAANINYGLTKCLDLHTDILWTGERSRPTGDSRGPASDFTTIDLALTLKNLYRNLELQAAVHNLLDEDYEDPDTSGSQMFIPDDFPREGTSVQVNVTYNF